MRHFYWLLLLSFAAVGRLALGGEGVSAVMPVDPPTAIWRMLLDYGSLGAFVGYLIWQKNQDGKQRIKDNERWHNLDMQFVEMVKDYSRVTTEVVCTLNELRKDVASSRHYVVDCEAEPRRGTVVMKRGE